MKKRMTRRDFKMLSQKPKQKHLSGAVLSSVLLIGLCGLLAAVSLPALAAPPPEVSPIGNQTGGHPHKLQLLYSQTGRVQIPGLYDEFTSDSITPIQGRAQFNRLVLGLAEGPPPTAAGDAGDRGPPQPADSSECLDGEAIQRAARTQTISLVQFYMASCPDCQGFSSYFKRFARDIAWPWRRLVQIYAVNCNDFQNIHLCQEQNPRLIVPLVRWYAFPILQRATLQAQAHAQGQSRPSSLQSAPPPCPRSLDYPRELLNVAHRQFIAKQRRDLISLREATVRFIGMVLDELASSDSLGRARKHGMPSTGATNDQRLVTPKRLFYESLPSHWHQLTVQLGHDQPDHLEAGQQFVSALGERLARCFEFAKAAASPEDATLGGNSTDGLLVRSFVVVEERPSFVGRTLVADWSSWTNCSRPSGELLLFHRTSDLRLLKGLSLDQRQVHPPLLLSFTLASNWSAAEISLDSLDTLEMHLLASNETQQATNSLRARRHATAQRPRLDRIQQRVSLERYYSQPGASGGTAISSAVKQPLRYAAAMSTSLSRLAARAQLGRSRRDLSAGAQNGTVATPDKEAQRLRAQAEAENINWAPEMLHPRVERLRWEFNLRIGQELGPPWDLERNSSVPGWHLRGQNPDEIPKSSLRGLKTIDPAEDDQSLMFLTDYYRSLDELVHIDLLSKGQVDGHQLLASCCFLRDLKRHFPFQGNAHASEQIGAKSVARHYVHLLQRAWLDELKKHLRRRLSTWGPEAGGVREKPTDERRADALLERLHEGDGCPRLQDLQAELGQHGQVNATELRVPLAEVQVPSRELEQIQLKIKRTHDVGLAPERHLKWRFCAGSADYLRGHTCSLWVLFHTLTVEEHLARQKRPGELADETGAGPNATAGSPAEVQEYQFQIDYSRAPRRPCDPNNPDGAYLASRPQELYANQTHRVLANIINFVRFYLPCTNCAAHFSCMVEHSSGLEFSGEQPSDAHLLWLWEGHNRVNERTRRTHSEDPARPKHIFPVYQACPTCYLEQPPHANATFASMRFNRQELVRFLVARYRRSAILNNKINIEDLYKKP